MDLASEFDGAQGICTLHVKGEFVGSSDSHEAQRVVADCYTKHGCTRFLIDMTEAKVVPGTMSLYDAGDPQGDVAQRLKAARSAFLVPQVTGNARFFENVATNRGYTVRLFDNREEAIKWLASPRGGNR